MVTDLVTYLPTCPDRANPFGQCPTYKTILTDLGGEVAMHEALRMKVLETLSDVTGQLDPDWPGQRS